MILETKYGRGVFADRNYKVDDIVESCECIFLSKDDVYHFDNPLQHYVFQLEENALRLALGNGSLYNHSEKFNLDYGSIVHYAFYSGRVPPKERPQNIIFWANRKIKKGEELTICYNDEPKFLSQEQALFTRTGKTK